MSKGKGRSGATLTMEALMIIAVVAIYLIASRASYSLSEVSFKHYPHTRVNDLIICIEGEEQPTNQQYILSDISDDVHALNPFIEINGDKHSFQTKMDGDYITKKINTLRLGCNTLSFGSSAGTFKLELKWDYHYRPVIEVFDAPHLRAGTKNKFTLYANKPIQETWMQITDVTRRRHITHFNKTFTGDTAEVRIDEPGNLVLEAQIFDGHVWSDIYDSPFSIHIITTMEEKSMSRLYEIPDQKAVKSPKKIPQEINPGDDPASKSLKRLINGVYIFTWKINNYIKWVIFNLSLKLEG